MCRRPALELLAATLTAQHSSTEHRSTRHAALTYIRSALTRRAVHYVGNRDLRLPAVDVARKRVMSSRCSASLLSCCVTCQCSALLVNEMAHCCTLLTLRPTRSVGLLVTDGSEITRLCGFQRGYPAFVSSPRACQWWTTCWPRSDSPPATQDSYTQHRCQGVCLVTYSMRLEWLLHHCIQRVALASPFPLTHTHTHNSASPRTSIARRLSEDNWLWLTEERDQLCTARCKIKSVPLHGLVLCTQP